MYATPDTSDRDEPATGATASGLVVLSFPVASNLLVLARLAVSSIASRSGFDIEEIEDLRLAVDELCLSVLDGHRSGRLLLHLDGTPDQIEVWCHHEGSEGRGDDPGGSERQGDDPDGMDGLSGPDGMDGLSARILDALVDEHSWATRDGREGARLCKRRTVRDA